MADKNFPTGFSPLPAVAETTELLGDDGATNGTLTPADILNLRSLAGTAFASAYDATTSEADPTAGKYRLNNATIASATQMYIDDLDANGMDMSVVLNDLRPGDHVLLVSGPDKDQVALFSITSISDETGYYKLVISNVSIGTDTSWTDTVLFGVLFIRLGRIDLDSAFALNA